MTDPELEAFRRGYVYGVENMADVNDELLVVLARLPTTVEDEEAIRLALGKARVLREDGAERMIALYRLEAAWDREAAHG